MGNEWLSWEQVMQEYQLSQEELISYCIEKHLPFYNADHKRVLPVSYWSPSVREQPHIVWGRIHLAENEVLTFHGQTEFSRIIFKGYPETGDFLIFRKDCIPTLQDEIFFRVLKRVIFPRILTENFWTDILEQSSIGNRKFVPLQELTYPSIFMPPDVLDVHLTESKFSQLKQVSSDLSPSIQIIEETTLLTGSDNKYEIPYSINKEGFIVEDKIIIYFEELNSQQEQDDEDSQSLHARYTYLSDKENFDYDPATSIWIKYHRSFFLIETVNIPVMRLSTVQSEKELTPAPSIQAVAQVARQYQPTSGIDAAKRLDSLYQFASFLTYIDTPHCTDEYETAILEGAAYCIFNGVYDDANAVYAKYLSNFFFNIKDLSGIGVRTISFNQFKDEIITDLKRAAHKESDNLSKRSLLTLAIKLDSFAKHSDVYAAVFQELKLINTGKVESKEDGAKRKNISEWLDKAEEWAVQNGPVLLPFPNWKSYTNLQAQKKYFTCLAERKGIALTDDAPSE